MANTRGIKRIIKSKATVEGAGVHLQRVFGYFEKEETDPFLLLDHFESDNPDDYVQGFPWHPHRGIETVTYMIEGNVEHGDSLGNKGTIRSGDVQWMTAGSGIIHQEMPQKYQGTLCGFQLWVNLPKAHKMVQPTYREISKERIPEVIEKDFQIKIIAGQYKGAAGPVHDLVTEPLLWDVHLHKGSTMTIETDSAHTVLAYVHQGKGIFDLERNKLLGKNTLVRFAAGNQVRVSTEEDHVKFLLISGKPLKEPIAWYGPIVMNSKEELETAFHEFQEGTFIKHGAG